MRLTLRTLLAYLDDRLSPANAREIGQKIAKSPFATELEERIKSVVRRRRLAKESVDQKTIDANLIAEYLDDQLTPELVALIEKEILSSDASLAEVAATHQILGLLSDPVELSQSLKDRLYKLAPGPSSEPGQGHTVALLPGSTETDWKPLTPQGTSQKRSPMLLLAVMVLGWLGLLATDAHLFQSSDATASKKVAAADEMVAIAAADAKPQQADNIVAANAEIAPAATPDIVAADTSFAGLETAANSPSVAVPENNASVPPTAAKNSIVASNALGPNMSKTSPNAATSIATNDKLPTPAASPTNDGAGEKITKTVTFHVDDPSSMVVLGDLKKNSWAWGTSAGTPDSQSWTHRLAGVATGIAEPFESRISSPELGWSAQVLGSSLFETINGEQPGISLLEGRLIVRQTAPLPQPVLFRLYLDEESLVISLPADGSQVAIGLASGAIDRGAADAAEYRILPDVGFGTLGIFASEADFSVVIDPAKEPITVGKGSHLVFRSNSGEPPFVSSMPPIPTWIFEAAQPKPESTSELIAQTAAEFRKSLTVADAATEVMENLNPQIAAYAVKLPALLRNVADLTAALMQSNVTGVRTEAIRGLHGIAQQNVGGRTRIAESLQTRLPEAELENVMMLLDGITPTAAEERSVSAWLVGMLSNNRAAIRELAIFNLEQLTGERNNFFPDDDASRRESAVRRWTKLLERNDGRLVTPPN